MSMRGELEERFEQGDTMAAIALALFDVAHEIRNLGGGGAMGSRGEGAVEFLAIQLKEGLSSVATALEEIPEALDRLPGPAAQP